MFRTGDADNTHGYMGIVKCLVSHGRNKNARKGEMLVKDDCYADNLKIAAAGQH
jgi:hypothetical protein